MLLQLVSELLSEGNDEEALKMIKSTGVSEDLFASILLDEIKARADHLLLDQPFAQSNLSRNAKRFVNRVCSLSLSLVIRDVSFLLVLMTEENLNNRNTNGEWPHITSNCLTRKRSVHFENG